MQTAILFVIKVFDNIVTTAKSITIYRNKEILSSILVIISQLMFYFVITKVIEDDSLVSIFVVSIASGVGTYLAFKINNRFKRDALWTNVLTCKDKIEIEKFCSFLVENKIKYIVNDSYSRKWEPRYSILVFSRTKHESKLIDEYLSESNVKFLRQVIK